MLIEPQIFTPERLHELSLHIHPGQADVRQHVVSHLTDASRPAERPGCRHRRQTTQNAARSVEQRGPNGFWPRRSHGSPCVQASIQHRKCPPCAAVDAGFDRCSRHRSARASSYVTRLGSPPASARCSCRFGADSLPLARGTVEVAHARPPGLPVAAHCDHQLPIRVCASELHAYGLGSCSQRRNPFGGANPLPLALGTIEVARSSRQLPAWLIATINSILFVRWLGTRWSTCGRTETCASTDCARLTLPREIGIRATYPRRNGRLGQIIGALQVEAQRVDLAVDAGVELFQRPQQRRAETRPPWPARQRAQRCQLVWPMRRDGQCGDHSGAG